MIIFFVNIRSNEYFPFASYQISDNGIDGNSVADKGIWVISFAIFFGDIAPKDLN